MISSRRMWCGCSPVLEADVMTTDEMKKRMQEHIADEIKDAEMYRALAEQHPEYESIFRDIAHDEDSHARVLEHILHHA